VIEHWFYATILVELALGVKFFLGQFVELQCGEHTTL
jgi:hypothetical protein